MAGANSIESSVELQKRVVPKTLLSSKVNEDTVSEYKHDSGSECLATETTV
jgi:hypothetical protein